MNCDQKCLKFRGNRNLQKEISSAIERSTTELQVPMKAPDVSRTRDHSNPVLTQR